MRKTPTRAALVMKRVLQALFMIGGTALAVTAVIAFRACLDTDLLWREHAATKHLGSGAVCADAEDLIVPCVKDGSAYQCIVDRDANISCAKVERLQ